MAELILPDSNVYIDAWRSGKDPFVRFAAALENDDEFATCGMVMLEVCRGVRDPNVLRRVRERFAVMIFVTTTNQVWERATELAWRLDRRGVVLPGPDLFIAACALQVGATVLTADAHFSAIPGLTVRSSLD